MQKFRKRNYEIIFSWLNLKSENSILKFVFLWIVLNQWYKTQFEKTKNDLSERDCVEKIKDDYQIFHRLLNNQNLPRDLEKNLVTAIKLTTQLNVVDICDIPEVLFDGFHIKQDKENFKRWIELLYSLRNQVFHGDVSVEDMKIQKLASCLNTFLEYFTGNVILDQRGFVA